MEESFSWLHSLAVTPIVTPERFSARFAWDEHLDHADERADHAPGRGAVAHRAIDLLPLLEMMEEDVAVALHRVLDELLVVAVRDIADALGEERVVDLHALERHRAVLAHHLGDLGQLLDELARMRAAHRERELESERQLVRDARERKADHRRGQHAAADHDQRVDVVEHPEVAAEEDQGQDDRDDDKKAAPGGENHENPPGIPRRHPAARVRALSPDPKGGALKEGLTLCSRRPAAAAMPRCNKAPRNPPP